MAATQPTWLPLPDVAERLGAPVSKIRRLVEDRQLAAKRIDGVLCVPESMLDGAEPVRDIAGTLTVLIDGGFSEDGALEWLLDESETLGCSPIDALRAGRKSEVRRLAQSLAF